MPGLTMSDRGRRTGGREEERKGEGGRGEGEGGVRQQPYRAGRRKEREPRNLI